MLHKLWKIDDKDAVSIYKVTMQRQDDKEYSTHVKGIENATKVLQTYAHKDAVPQLRQDLEDLATSLQDDAKVEIMGTLGHEPAIIRFEHFMAY